jgi:hypothetical protein
LEKEGIALRKDIVRTFLPDQHKGQIKIWQKSVLDLIAAEAPVYENEMLLPPSHRQPMKNATESDLARADIEEWLQKLHKVIDDIEG